jgi:hypothetical protein
MVDMIGITETTRRVAAIVASCPGVIMMDHLNMAEVMAVTH